MSMLILLSCAGFFDQFNKTCEAEFDSKFCKRARFLYRAGFQRMLFWSNCLLLSRHSGQLLLPPGNKPAHSFQKATWLQQRQTPESVHSLSLELTRSRGEVFPSAILLRCFEQTVLRACLQARFWVHGAGSALGAARPWWACLERGRSDGEMGDA